jgi:diadenosine tetraphosphatase ApaH/serine/threonine PP2A family protein phosphatase
MRVAIVSDINANEQAWNSVLADTELRGIDQYICLGDIVGCGPAPREVLESVSARANWILAGERDLAVAGKISLDQFTPDAREVIEWTREHLSADACRFLGDLPLVMEGEGFACTHAEFECPQRFSYLDHAGSILGSLETIAQPMLFTGHTRLPAVTEIRPNHSMKTFGIDDFQLRTGCRYLVNVGSVGDPRDGNPRACYCIYDTETYSLEFRRAAFDVPTWDVEISINELPIQPYVISVLKRGVMGAGGAPSDFIPGLPAEVNPAVLEFASPMRQVQIAFDGAARTRAATSDGAYASEDRMEYASEDGTEWATEDVDGVELEEDEEPEPGPVAVVVEGKKEGKGKLIAAALAALCALGILAATIASLQKKQQFRPPVAQQQPNKPKKPRNTSNNNQKPPQQKPPEQKPPQEKPPEQKPHNGNPPASQDGLIKLAKGQIIGRNATFSGASARFMRGKEKNYIVWDSADAVATWKRVDLRAGAQKVSILQAGYAEGIEVEIEIDDQVLFGEFTKVDQGYVRVELGEIILPQSENGYQITAKVVGTLEKPVRLKAIKFENK